MALRLVLLGRIWGRYGLTLLLRSLGLGLALLRWWLLAWRRRLLLLGSLGLVLCLRLHCCHLLLDIDRTGGHLAWLVQGLAGS